MKISPVLFLILIVSCKKNIDAPPAANDNASANSIADTRPEVCDFGLQVFNKVKRTPLQHDYSLKKKPRIGQEATAKSTILLDFDGHMVSNTVWNSKGAIHATPANLKEIEIDRILQRVSEDFSPFDVNVTTDESVYNSTDPFKRMRVIITENWEWFGVVGGTAYDHSFSWGNNTPCFIFSTLLSYNEKYIAEAISHETGHTLGLRHQALYDGSCNLISEFNLGYGEGVTSWAPIMGIAYYRNVTTWHQGPTVSGCNDIQDDVAILSGMLGLRPDDNAEMNRDKVSTSEVGIINTGSDIDYYYLDIKEPTTVFVHPKCLEDEQGANLNLKINIYDKRRVLLKTIDDPSSLSVSTVLPIEKYFIGIETEANENQNRYGMLGRYMLSIE